jgi:hypothetical protein
MDSLTLINEYDNLLIQYQQAVLDYVNSLSTSSSSSVDKPDLKVTPQTTFWGTSAIDTLTGIDKIDKCIDACSSNKECNGATFHETKKICWLRKGKGPIVASDDSLYSSIIPQSNNLLLNVQGINKRLIDLNKQIIESLDKSLIDATSTQIDNNADMLKRRYKELQYEQAYINNTLETTGTLTLKTDETQQYVNTYYNVFILFFFFTVTVLTVTYYHLEPSDYAYVICGLLIAAILLVLHTQYIRLK